MADFRPMIGKVGLLPRLTIMRAVSLPSGPGVRTG